MTEPSTQHAGARRELIAFRIADQVIILANGGIAAQGTPDEVRHSDNPLVHQFVNALAEGPVKFHHPAPPIEDDFSVPGRASRGRRA